MADVVDPAKRSLMMSGIRGKNTKPELVVRSLLHRLGYRFRLHRKDLPGKPDIFLPRHGVVVFVHGCFWHRHACHLFKWPTNNREFWRTKIERNVEVDSTAMAALLKDGYRVLTVWECALKGKARLSPERTADLIEVFLTSEKRQEDIVGVVQ